jgi:hypothetical protein
MRSSTPDVNVTAIYISCGKRRVVLQLVGVQEVYSYLGMV